MFIVKFIKYNDNYSCLIKILFTIVTLKLIIWPNGIKCLF